MLSLLRVNLLVLAIFMQASALGWAQAVPARLALFGDPTPPVSADQLVLGVTTLEEAQRLFPDAPSHPGPMTHAKTNPHRVTLPDLKLGNTLLKPRHAFFLGTGRAVLYFDEHKRLISIEQGRFGYFDPATGKSVSESTPWEATPISRNEFRAHYPGIRGEWFDHLHYLIEGPISDCLGLIAWFEQRNGYDDLLSLTYHYTCPTQPSAE
jgi:hypothetical protein